MIFFSVRTHNSSNSPLYHFRIHYSKFKQTRRPFRETFLKGNTRCLQIWISRKANRAELMSICCWPARPLKTRVIYKGRSAWEKFSPIIGSNKKPHKQSWVVNPDNNIRSAQAHTPSVFDSKAHGRGVQRPRRNMQHALALNASSIDSLMLLSLGFSSRPRNSRSISQINEAGYRDAVPYIYVKAENWRMPYKRERSTYYENSMIHTHVLVMKMGH